MSDTSKANGQGRDDSSAEGFSEQERAAMKARAKELKTEARGARTAKKAASDEAAVLSTIAEMAEPDGALAARVHAVITAAAPEPVPKLWYGQPAYARDGKVVCCFRSGQADKERYSSLGFTTEANLDDDSGLWPTCYALPELTEAGEATLSDLVKQAMSR
ncbi:MAG TPA: DUF1801 domain-containing protein [Glycomyces sp.]|nr:DUF1801 domain-containing protein [Glycomyces sp.]